MRYHRGWSTLLRRSLYTETSQQETACEGVMMCDVNSGNGGLYRIDGDGVLKVGDFGLSEDRVFQSGKGVLGDETTIQMAGIHDGVLI